MPAKSTRPKPTSKPEKPYEGFPLFAHAGSGQWAKKICKRLHYFGSWRQDREGTAALERFNREWPYLREGRTPPAVDTNDGCSLRQLVNAFLASKEDKLRADDLSPRSFRDYYRTCSTLIDYFGKERRVDDLRPDDFQGYRNWLVKRLGPVSLGNEINRTRIVFRFAHDQRLIEHSIAYGQSFNRPSAKALRRERNAAGPKLFTRDELLTILDALDGKPVVPTDDGEPRALKPDPFVKAMTLLSLNTGFGNSDIASLPKSALDLESGWVTFPRVKTEIPRRVPLWPETCDALRVALGKRPTPRDKADDRLVFLTRQGRPWVRMQAKAKPDDESNGQETEAEAGPEVLIPIDTLGQRFINLLHKLRINGRRGLGYYTLRHCFETYAGESKDQVAVDAIMGHVDSSMSANYRHRISDERLRAVVNVVHDWLYSPNSTSTEGTGEGGEL